MTRIRRLVVVVLGCLFLAASTSSAAATDPAQGRAAFDEGQRLFLARDYRGALASFEKGFLSTEDAAFLLNMAQCHRFLGEPKGALMMYRLYLKSSPEAVNPKAYVIATNAIRELESEMAVAPPATAPAAVDKPAASPPAPAPASPAVEIPVPLVAGSGRKFRQAPATYPDLESMPDGDVKKEPLPSATLPDNTETTARHLRLAGMICGAAGLVSVGAGVYYWTRATSLSDSANKAIVFNSGDYDQGKRAEKMQWIFYGVGAAAIATGAILYVYARWLPAGKKASVSLVPVVVPGAAGLAAHGAF